MERDTSWRIDGLVERTEGKEKQDKRMEDSDGEGKLTDIQ